MCGESCSTGASWNKTSDAVVFTRELLGNMADTVTDHSTVQTVPRLIL